jgi:hypothetical protein
MLQCTAPCPDPTEELGNVLYAGPFNPVFPPPTTPNHEPQQNFTVTVPSFFQSGQTVQLAALVYTLIGVSVVLFRFCAFVMRGTNKRLVLQAELSSTIQQASEILDVQ